MFAWCFSVVGFGVGVVHSLASLQSIMRASFVPLWRDLVKPYLSGNLFPLLGKVCRLLGKNCHGIENAMQVFAVFYLVRKTWHGVCYVYWQAGTIP